MAVVRIIKKILKKSIHQDSFYSEINILKSIRHPNIPIIYDVEEDALAYYIIEEYIEGKTLSQYIAERGALSQDEAVSIGIKICEIISFLHGQKPVPVLFLDVHPKNILINNDKIFLVDFGSSFFSDETEKRRFLMGSVGYAAPEQYRYDALDERTDIYGIGAVLFFMVTGKSCGQNGTISLKFPNNISGKYRMVVMQCVSNDRNGRFRSVDMIAENLRELIKNDEAYNFTDRPQIISVAGTQTRIGTTHISIALASFLASKGCKVIYEEMNESNHLRMIARRRRLKYENGFFYKDSLMLKPSYGPQVQLCMECSYIVRDYGCLHGDLEPEGDMVLLLAGAKEWEIENSCAVCSRYLEESREAGKNHKIHFLCNMSHYDESKELWRMVGNIGTDVPFISDIFCADTVTENFFRELTQALGIECEGGGLYKKKTRLFGRTAKKTGNSRNRNNRSSQRSRCNNNVGIHG